MQDDGGTANGGVDLDQRANTITVDVTSVNDAPAGTDNTVTINEDTAYTFAAADFGFSDAERQPGQRPGGGEDHHSADERARCSRRRRGHRRRSSSLAADIDAGNLTFTPAANANGTPYATFTFQVQDDGGTANGGIDLDQSANTITVNVNSVNDAPAGADSDGHHATRTRATSSRRPISASATRSKPRQRAAAVKITTLPAAGTLHASRRRGDRRPVRERGRHRRRQAGFTPAANANGAGYASFTFQVQDDGGTANGGVDLDQSANTITINVTAVNDAPAGTERHGHHQRGHRLHLRGRRLRLQRPGRQPGQRLAAVKITTLPTAGTLTLDGAPVTAGQFVIAADIGAGNLASRRPPTPTAPPTPASPSRCRTTAAPPMAASTSTRAPTPSPSTSPPSTTRRPAPTAR